MTRAWKMMAPGLWSSHWSFPLWESDRLSLTSCLLVLTSWLRDTSPRHDNILVPRHLNPLSMVMDSGSRKTLGDDLSEGIVLRDIIIKHRAPSFLVVPRRTLMDSREKRGAQRINHGPSRPGLNDFEPPLEVHGSTYKIK